MSLRKPDAQGVDFQKFQAAKVQVRLLITLLAILMCFASGCGRSGSPELGPALSSIEDLPAASQTGHDPLASSVPHAPGPSATLYESPTYSCIKRYYVSTRGNDSNKGTRVDSPWRTLAHAAEQTLTAGSCVNVSPGAYLQAAPLRIAHGGTHASQAGYVTWRCTTMPFHFSSGVFLGEGTGCVIRANAAMFALVPISASYVIFDGFEIDGHIYDAQRGFQVSGPGVHHSWLLNSDVHHCGQSGVSLVWSDWLFVIHDVWHDNSACSVDFISPCKATIGSYGSGLSIWEPRPINSYVTTTDDDAFCSNVPKNICYHIVVEYNVAYHNYNAQIGSKNTDGEGIIFDTWDNAPYTGAGLIMGNVVYDNGGSGIEVADSSKSGAIMVANNTTFANHWDTHSPFTWSGELVEDSGFNVTNINNIAYAVSGPGILAGNPPFVAQQGDSGSTWSNNLSYPPGRNRFASISSFPTSGKDKNYDGLDPEFELSTPRSASNNFALMTGSPAIGFGQMFSLWPQRESIDAGACPRTLAECP